MGPNEDELTSLSSDAAAGAGERVRLVRPSLLSLLIEAGVASDAELRVVAAEGMGAGERLGEAVLRRGWIDERGLARLLARQWALPFVEAESVSVGPVADDPLPHEQARELGAFCFRGGDGALWALVADPSTEQLNRLRQALGDVRFAVTTAAGLERLLAGAVTAPTFGAGAEAAPAVANAPAAPANVLDGQEGAPAAVERSLLDELDATTARLRAVHGRVAELLSTQQATLTEVHALEEEVERLRAQRLDDESRIRALEEHCQLERQRYRSLVTQLVQLTASHQADSNTSTT